jgi:hypothetical protein
MLDFRSHNDAVNHFLRNVSPRLAVLGAQTFEQSIAAVTVENRNGRPQCVLSWHCHQIILPKSQQWFAMSAIGGKADIGWSS